MLTHTSAFLQVEHISKEVKSGDTSIVILRDINLALDKGVTLAILGASGSGKTTLLTLMAGLDLPTSGHIYFQNRHLSDMSEEARALLRGKEIGFIFQTFELLPTLTALENVMLPLEIQYMPHSKSKMLATQWLAKIGLDHRLNHYPSQLSGGEQQRVAIARAFVNKPKIIFADEMTGNLDTATGKKVIDIIFSLNKEEKTTLVLVTHDSNLASRCQIQMLLQNGELKKC